jgi:hypothetical protein
VSILLVSRKYLDHQNRESLEVLACEKEFNEHTSEFEIESPV